MCYNFIYYQSRDLCVKCLLDGELSRERKVFLRFRSCIPLLVDNTLLGRIKNDQLNGMAAAVPFLFIYMEGINYMVNQNKIQQAVTLLLEAIGENTGREGLIETPKRVAKMYAELTAGYYDNASTHLSKVFSVNNSEMVLEKDIAFHSLCEHHLLPFFGKVHIAYIPDGKVVGISKLARVVEVFARRLQIQEQITNQIAQAINDGLSPKGVFVVVEAEHTCITMRGIKKIGSKTLTLASCGVFRDNIELQKSVRELIRL